MADEYISKQDAANVVANTAKIVASFNYQYAIDALLALTPADVAPVVHSRWVLGGYDDMYYVCKKCGHKQSEYYHKPTAKYCPNCGAKMDGEE